MARTKIPPHQRKEKEEREKKRGVQAKKIVKFKVQKQEEKTQNRWHSS